MSGLSAWCWTPPGFTHTAAQHRKCQMRQDEPDERIRLGPCDCREHGGHTTKKDTA